MAELENGNEIAEDFAVPDAEMGNSEGDELNGNPTLTLPLEDSELAVQRRSFIDQLGSPIVTLVVGSGEVGAVLTAHQALLTQSPFFSAACADFTDDGSVCPHSSAFCLGC